jgi:PIN domain nuclease of toxin-antitoxin system
MAERLPSAAQALIGEHEPCFSPIAVLELAYLHEIGRARDSLPTMLGALRRDIGLDVADASTIELAQAATELSWTRDPFDRLIAAHAIVANAPLITADQTIRKHLPLAVWD